MRVLPVLLALPLFAACGSDVPDPSLNGVFPTQGFTNRQVRVEISGDLAEWSSNATADFGEGITVDQIDVASPNTIFAQVTISGAATLGLHDVTVTDRGRTLTLSQAFQIDSPITATIASGLAAQGSIALVQ